MLPIKANLTRCLIYSISTIISSLLGLTPKRSIWRPRRIRMQWKERSKKLLASTESMTNLVWEDRAQICSLAPWEETHREEGPIWAFWDLMTKFHLGVRALVSNVISTSTLRKSTSKSKKMKGEHLYSSDSLHILAIQTINRKRATTSVWYALTIVRAIRLMYHRLKEDYPCIGRSTPHTR